MQTVASESRHLFSLCYSRFPLRLNIVCCVWWLRIAWLGSVAKLSIFTATEHHGIKGEARHTLSVAVREAVYHKLVLRNHDTQHAMFKCNGNRLYYKLNPLFMLITLGCSSWACNLC